ncbi:MAG: SGNH/GDSL hydrolase family protein [Ginsengibacter sp.]
MKLKIVAFGNSTTAERSTISQVFAQRLPALLKQKDIPAFVINAGIPGSHSGHRFENDVFKIPHALDRFETEVLNKMPDLVIINFGINDAYIDAKVKNGLSRIPLKQFVSNMTLMTEALQKRNIAVLLVVPNPLGDKYPEFQNERLNQYKKTIRKLAKTHQTGFCDIDGLFRKFEKENKQSFDSLLLDGVHPNDKGHELIAALLADEIETMIRYISKEENGK